MFYRAANYRPLRNHMSQHQDPNVQTALVRLCDALCTWERNTGRTSALVLREMGGYCFRAASGKPLPSVLEDISDAELFETEAPKGN